MYKKMILLSTLFFFVISSQLFSQTTHKVNSSQELEDAIKAAKAGDEIVLSNGVWENVQIRFTGKGTAEKPITLRAETPGKVTLEGQSSLKIGGEYLIVDGLYFKNGYTATGRVIEFRVNRKLLANHCKVINCVIEDYTQPNRYTQDLWVEFFGKHNQLDRCYLAGKFNQGPTLRVNLRGNEHIKNYHQITNNYFGPRPRKGGPRAETIQIGASYTSIMPSYVNVSNNLFEKCNGEVEVISSKSNFNEFRNNVFYKCEGSMVTRHGNFCIIDGNFFIGEEKSAFTGGMRIINTGHWISNNYFYRINGDEFRAPLAIMNGIPKSSRNRYHQVTDAVVAHNTWVDCKSPWQISVGANSDKSDVLPPSEIRSERPIRTIIANNIIYNDQVESKPIKAYDKIDGITFKNNLINNQSEAIENDALAVSDLKMKQVSDWLYLPTEFTEAMRDVYPGYEFDNIETDILGNTRSSENAVGAISKTVDKMDLDRSKYGPTWYSPKREKFTPKVIAVSADANISEAIAAANSGDILALDGATYKIDRPLDIKKQITIKAKNKDNKPKIVYAGDSDTPVFQMNPRGHLTVSNVVLKGSNEQHAFAPLAENMSFGYNLFVNDCEIENFKNVHIAYKGSFADTVSFVNTTMKDCMNGLELAAETDDKGDYNAEFFDIINCEFKNIEKNVVHFYRGGYDESTIGGVLKVHGSKFSNCGSAEESNVLVKTRGIINVDISENTFQNNAVKYVAVLWGEKNNHHSGNKISDSGEILVERFLKQKLMY